MYSAESGFTGSFETFSFQGLLGGKTWQPPTFVGEVAVAVGACVGGGVWWVGVSVCRTVAVAVVVAVGGAVVCNPGTWGRTPRTPPPPGVGTD
jgi:hypothetical protein